MPDTASTLGIPEYSYDVASGRRRRRALGEACLQFSLGICAAISVCISTVTILLLAAGSIRFFAQSGFEFDQTPISGLDGVQNTIDQNFYLWSLLRTSLGISAVATLIAVPPAVLTATYINEFAPVMRRRWMGAIVDLLHGIPTVVWGFIAVATVAPWMRQIVPAVGNADFFIACLAVAAMLVPTVIRLVLSVLRIVPQSIRDSAMALGSSRAEATRRVTLPAAASGIFAAILIALVRAFGETMIVTLVAATASKGGFFFSSIETFTTAIVQILSSSVVPGERVFDSLFVMGLLLFTFAYVLSHFAQGVLYRLAKKYRRAYA